MLDRVVLSWDNSVEERVFISIKQRAVETMQFIAKGPEIPSGLLQAHQEGKVVFFTGAGISYRAGLPTFQGLVEAIYRELGESCTPEEEKALTGRKFDSVLDLLEGRIRGKRCSMRKALFKSLKVKRLTEASSPTLGDFE